MDDGLTYRLHNERRAPFDVVSLNGTLTLRGLTHDAQLRPRAAIRSSEAEPSPADGVLAAASFVFKTTE